ncbi:MAG: hypothetical protein E7324_10365 [Clostridiales bacterium]|nr:hypothetical protein [Clostridiales bacterium]
MLLHGPWTEEELKAAVRKLIHIPLPGLAAHTEMQRMEIAGELLAQLDVPGQLKGWRYIQYAAACCACSGFLMQDWGRRVYPLVANRFGTSSGAVERAIRTAVENTWLTGNLQGIQQLFGFSVDADRGKPTNAEFIAMLAAHTARILDGKLQKDGGM